MRSKLGEGRHGRDEERRTGGPRGTAGACAPSGRGAAIDAGKAPEAGPAAIVRQRGASEPGAGRPGLLGVQLVFRFGELALRRGDRLQLDEFVVQFGEVVLRRGFAPGPITCEAEPAGECDCLLIEEHLSRCVFVGRA